MSGLGVKSFVVLNEVIVAITGDSVVIYPKPGGWKYKTRRKYTVELKAM